MTGGEPDPRDRYHAVWNVPGRASWQGADPLGNLAFNRAFYSQMIFRSFDRTGRIVLPGDLAERFPKREVTIVGAGRYLELWNPPDFTTSITPLDFA